MNCEFCNHDPSESEVFLCNEDGKPGGLPEIAQWLVACGYPFDWIFDNPPPACLVPHLANEWYQREIEASGERNRFVQTHEQERLSELKTLIEDQL